MSKMSRKEYADLFGPTTGDKIRLADTDLYIEIEKDLRTYGDEAVYGGGKTLRDGMGMDTVTSAAGALDLVITNATIVDPYLGVIKADVGIKDGRIVGVGKAGNPNTMAGVTPGLSVGPATDAISAEHLILTPSGMDSHTHQVCPQQVQTALSNGITTFWGGGIGPSDGTNGTTITSGPWHLEMMLRAIEGLPINFGFLGKGNSSGRGPLVEQILAGATGLKVHEDWAQLLPPFAELWKLPTNTTCRFRFTPIRSTKADILKIPSPPLTVGQFIPFTLKEPGVGTHRT